MHASIPATRAMGFRVGEFSDTELTMRCPLEGNTNDKGTAFAGTQTALATTCGWGLLMLLARTEYPQACVAVKNSSAEYPKPGRGDLTASCRIADLNAVISMHESLAAFGFCDLKIRGNVRSAEVTSLFFEATYRVYLPGRPNRTEEPVTDR